MHYDNPPRRLYLCLSWARRSCGRSSCRGSRPSNQSLRKLSGEFLQQLFPAWGWGWEHRWKHKYALQRVFFPHRVEYNSNKVIWHKTTSLKKINVCRFITSFFLRLYEIVGEDCVGLNLQQLRPISLRDLVRWCTRTTSNIKSSGWCYWLEGPILIPPFHDL